MAFAAVQGDLAVIEAEFALLLLRTVAFHTVLLKDRLHLRLERDGGGQRSGGQQQGGEEGLMKTHVLGSSSVVHFLADEGGFPGAALGRGLGVIRVGLLHDDFDRLIKG